MKRFLILMITMKKYILSYLLVLCISIVYAQEKDWRLLLKDEYYKTYGSKGLKIGDKMPELSLQYVMNNKTGKTKLSDFKGKLIILDFWSTICSDCIHDFPRMEALQKTFGEKIQIFTVNVAESEESINKARRFPYFKNVVLPDLPGIVANPKDSTNEDWKNSQLFRMLPNRGVPYHVWIDQAGIIRLMGGHENTNEKSIENFLAGKPSYASRSTANTPVITDKDISYQKLSTMMNPGPLVQMSSFFTPYNNEISANPFGVFYRNILDSVNHSKRSIFMNMPLRNIYMNGYFLPMYSAKVLSKISVLAQAKDRGDSYTSFEHGVDTLLYTFEYQHVTTESFPYNNCCYEQILPSGTSEADQLAFMFEDLNRYCSQKFKCIAEVVQTDLPVYVLKRTSDKDLIKSRSTGKGGALISEPVGIQKIVKFTNCNLSTVFKTFIDNDQSGFKNFLRNNKQNNKPFLLINGLGSNINVDMELPTKNIDSIEKLNETLQTYGLIAVVETRTIPILHFKKVSE